MRGGRLGHLARGVRDDPPRQKETRGRGSVLAAHGTSNELGSHVYRKQVRRRRAVLALLIVGSFVLLTVTYGSGSNGLQRGVSTIFSPVQSVADGALKPARDLVNWFDQTFDARGRNEPPAGRTAHDPGGGGRRQRGAGRKRAAAQAAGARPQRSDPFRLRAGYGKGDRALPDRLVLRRHDRRRQRRRRRGRRPGRQRRRPGRHRLCGDRRLRPGDADRRPLQRRLGQGRAGGGPGRDPRPTSATPSDLILDFIDSTKHVHKGQAVVTAGWRAAGNRIALPAQPPDRRSE